ncbi:MAG: recombinase family protein [Desulfosporosinus sp.]
MKGIDHWKPISLMENVVDGCKVSAKDRDAIQEIQQDAAQGKFDILLVYMCDRLGRREDETPFVVEWFVRNGIEVWSTIEGQQRQTLRRRRQAGIENPLRLSQQGSPSAGLRWAERLLGRETGRISRKDGASPL